MRRFITLLAALMVLAGPAFAQSDLKANDEKGHTDKSSPSEPMKHKKRHTAHRKTTTHTTQGAAPAPAPAPAAGANPQ